VWGVNYCVGPAIAGTAAITASAEGAASEYTSGGYCCHDAN
jgi:hypothetical protein